MSKKKPIEINIGGKLWVVPNGIFISRVVHSGNGAVIKFFKRFLDKEVIVIVAESIKNKEILNEGGKEK